MTRVGLDNPPTLFYFFLIVLEKTFKQRFSGEAGSIDHPVPFLTDHRIYLKIIHLNGSTMIGLGWSRPTACPLIMLNEIFDHSSIKTTKIYLGIREKEIMDVYQNL